MAQAKSGDRVKVDYTGRFDDGTIFDSSVCSDDDCGHSHGPLEFTVGNGEVIPGFDSAVTGMEPGETKTIRIDPVDGYGERNAELTAQVPRGELPPDIQPQVGQQLEVTQTDGQVFQVMITDVNDESITIDANHPLAGQALNFEITLKEIEND